MADMDSQLEEKCLKKSYLIEDADYHVDNDDGLTDERSNKSTLSIHNAKPTEAESLITVKADDDDELTSIELTRCEKCMQYPIWIWKGTCKVWYGFLGLIIPKAIEKNLEDDITILGKETEDISTANLNPKNSPLPMTESLGSDVESFTDSDESIDVVGSLKQKIEDMLKTQQLNSDLEFSERKRRHEEEMRENWSKFRDIMEVKVKVEKEEFNRWASSLD